MMYPDEKQLIRYLLGDVTEEEQSEVERLYFTDDEVYQLLLVLEAELIDRYVARKLTKREAMLFRAKHGTSPQVQKELRFAAAISRQFSLTNILRMRWNSYVNEFLGLRPMLRVGFALFLLLGLFGFWAVIRSFTQRGEIQRLEAEYKDIKQRLSSEQSRSKQLAEALEAERSKHPKLPVVSFVLLPGVLRSAESSPTLVLPKTPALVELKLEIESKESYPSYRVVLKREDGAVVWSEEGLTQSRSNMGGVIRFSIRSEILQRGDFMVELFGQQDARKLHRIHVYTFAVRRNSS